jgi:hypothetical protein
MFLRFPIHQLKLNMVEHTCHSSVWEAWIEDNSPEHKEHKWENLSQK